jgi:hypothetical protein
MRHGGDSIVCIFQKTLSSQHSLNGPKGALSSLGYTPSLFMEPNTVQLSKAAQRMAASTPGIGGVYTPPGDVYSPPRSEKTYNTPEGRAVYWPETERYGDPPDLPSLLLANRVIYVAMPVSGNRRSTSWRPFSVAEVA